MLGTLGAPGAHRRSAARASRRGRAGAGADRARDGRATAAVRVRDEAPTGSPNYGLTQEALDGELADAFAVLNRALRARRAAAADPYLAELSLRPGAGGAGRLRARRRGGGRALRRGAGAAAPGSARVKRSMESPEERFAALLGARETPAGGRGAGAARPRRPERRTAARGRAAGAGGAGGAELAEHRSRPAPRPWRGGQRGASGRPRAAREVQALTEAIEGMEAALRRHRLGG